MDVRKFYSIREALHVYCNPVNTGRLERFLALLRLKQDASVLDIACGKAEFLVRIAELYNVTGVGVDISPYFIQTAQAKAETRMPNARLTFINMDAKNYKPPAPFDLTSCMGATWIWNGYKGTLEALKNMTKPGGMVVVGEPYWLKRPEPEYLKVGDMTREDFAESHYDNIKTGEASGLDCIYTIVSSKQDFDNYETSCWWAIVDYAKANPTDPDLPEILARMNGEKHIYLQWQRDTMGWALYVFKKS